MNLLGLKSFRLNSGAKDDEIAVFSSYIQGEG